MVDPFEVLEILREQPRNLETIGWGIYQIFSHTVSAHDLLHALEELESKGMARQHVPGMPGMPMGVWWCSS
jgi:hypothetical protein